MEPDEPTDRAAYKSCSEKSTKGAYQPHSSSASRFTAEAFGFLNLSQSGDPRPNQVGAITASVAPGCLRWPSQVGAGKLQKQAGLSGTRRTTL
jgi:hypothetical protein